jgi:hypothetical protein
VAADDADSGLRLAELVAAFSLATDLGLGQPMEHVHAIVTSSDGAVHELWWAPVPPVLLGVVLATG